MAIQTPNLPFELDALEPHISKETLEYHYGKHHLTYVKKTIALLENAPKEVDQSNLESIVKTSSGSLFNNAAQIWNHSFYWDCLSEQHNQTPEGPLLNAINKHFESVDAFQSTFASTAANLFGSGWAWLVQKADGSLAIVTTVNAETPLTTNDTPLLTCDVWEHAYYIDTRNSRPKYLENFWHIVAWDKIATRFKETT
jgi:superoxide dismutase, Fe-Mn family